MDTFAGIRIERAASGVRLVPPAERRWLTAALLIGMLAGAAWLTASSENGVAVFMAADFVLWCWVAASADWKPVRRLRRALEIRASVDGYRAGAARQVLVDGAPIAGRARGAAITQVHSRSGPPALVVFFVADGAIVRLATTKDRDQALALARLVHAELLIAGEPRLYAESPAPGAAGCAALLVVALVLFAAYLAVAFAIEALPTWQREIALSAAVVHGALAIGLRHGLDLAGAGATRRAAERIFGTDAVGPS